MPVDYETTFVLKPTLTEDEINEFVEKVSQILSNSGATINNVNHWGRRRLAYEIQKNTEGYYVFIAFAMERSAEVVNQIERFYRLQENILRYLTVVAPDPTPRGRRKDKRKEKAEQLVQQQDANNVALGQSVLSGDDFDEDEDE